MGADVGYIILYALLYILIFHNKKEKDGSRDHEACLSYFQSQSSLEFLPPHLYPLIPGKRESQPQLSWVLRSRDTERIRGGAGWEAPSKPLSPSRTHCLHPSKEGRESVGSPALRGPSGLQPALPHLCWASVGNVSFPHSNTDLHVEGSL